MDVFLQSEYYLIGPWYATLATHIERYLTFRLAGEDGYTRLIAELPTLPQKPHVILHEQTMPT
eukprot:scaffold90294_cov18-Prasinocladus_malaysianus.AAC.2